MENNKIELNNSLPKVGTNSAVQFFSSVNKDLKLFYFVVNNVVNMDYASYRAREALDGNDDVYSEPSELLDKKPGKLTLQLREHKQELIEMFFSRLVDNFQVYIIDIIREILKVKPQILYNRQPTVSMEQILKYDNIDALVQDLIEEKVSSLSYSGLGKVQEWCKERGIPLELPEDRRETIIEYIAIRNLIIHNRGYVDERYVKTIRNTKFKNGMKRNLSVDNLYDAIKDLNSVVYHTDEKAHEKFQLETMEFPIL
ncbi:hypothetical protein [Bacillus norwichensis]|uniref:RiboL-PSP-HEPN domain-containing protein n=1 Tax=Bacillus norwichensis TaxID=2762217 RepID=A0ABR8VQZ0_9BACI|nr:hypothetical protein [Bacillus norwichensis]MBD8006831.1 hypothetical protein [Bacillus norwichensis]